MKLSEIKTNEVEIKNYDKVIGYAGRCRKPMIDWVTEYTYITDKNLTEEEFINVLGGVSGQVRFIKKVMNFANGAKLYKHICESISY